MDVTKIRLDFSTHMLQLDELNKQLMQHISDLQGKLNEQKKKHEDTAEILLKTQTKLLKATTDGMTQRNNVLKYKNRLRRYHELTKTKEVEWIRFTKDLKTFYVNCSCQSKDTSVNIPSQFSNEVFTQPKASEFRTSQSFISPSQEPVNKTSNMTTDINTTPIKKTPQTLQFSQTGVPISRPLGVSKLKRIRRPVPQSVKRKCVAPDGPLLASQATNITDNEAPDSSLLTNQAANITDKNNSSETVSVASTPESKPEQSNAAVLYAEDSQEPASQFNNSEGDLSFVKALSKPSLPGSAVAPETPVSNLPKPFVPSYLEVSDSISPVLNLHALSQAAPEADPLSDTQVMNSQDGDQTTIIAPSTHATRPPKKLNILTEYKGNVSLSEELLGFSLPECKKECLYPENEVDMKEDVTDIEEEDVPNDLVSCVKTEGERIVSKPADMPSSSVTGQAPTTHKHARVVRKKEERAKLAASSCPSCYRYYTACGLDEEEILKLIGDVSRHRHQHGQKTESPPGLWDLSIAHDTIPTEPATQKKQHRRNKYMRGGDS